MSDVAHALWYCPPNRAEIRCEALRVPGPDEVRVAARFGAVSRGTERLVYTGRVPSSQRDRMRAPHQVGPFEGPLKYGYANVGVVEAGPSALVGRNVFCLHPHQTRYVVSVDAVVPIPAGVPIERAVLAANMETALNATWDAAPRIGDHVAVVGAGVVGALVARLVGRMPGVRVELVDVDGRKALLAHALGVGFAEPGDARGDADLVFHASGAPAGLRTALGLAGFEATVVELSWFGDRAVSLPLGEAFHAGRLRIQSSQVGTIAEARRARWNHRRRMSLALDLLRDDALDALIDDEGPFEALPDTLARLAGQAGPTGRTGPTGQTGPTDPTLCHLVRYPMEALCTPSRSETIS